MSDLEIRRPELLGVRRTGTVRWFSDDKGYGRITADDGEVLFVHHVNIVSEGYRSGSDVLRAMSTMILDTAIPHEGDSLALAEAGRDRRE